MRRNDPRSHETRGREEFEKLLAVMLLDRPESPRIRVALERWEAAAGPIRNAQQGIEALQYMEQTQAEAIADVRRTLAGTVMPTYILEDLRFRIADDRRIRAQLLRAIPNQYFTGVPLEIPEADALRVAKIEGQAVPEAVDAESAFALLPVTWLRRIHEIHDRGRRPRTRVLLAADCATPLYDPPVFRNIVEREFSADHLRLLARVVASGRLPEDAFSPAERDGLRVGFDWRQPAAGVGGRLRQLGCLFVGMQDGRRTVYVPESARPAMALIVGKVLLEREVPGAAQLARALGALSARAETDRVRRHASRAPGLVQAEGLPSRRSRIRYKTPGPDRVVELEIVLRGGKPRVLRRIRISYQRPVGALHEAIQLAFGLANDQVHSFQAFRRGEVCRLFLDPAHDAPLRAEMDEWRVSIREALAHAGGTLVYTYGPPRGRQEGVPFDVRRVCLHAPEAVAARPRVVWADGVLAPVLGVGAGSSDASSSEASPSDASPSEASPSDANPSDANPSEASPSQASLDAANVFLERLDP